MVHLFLLLLLVFTSCVTENPTDVDVSGTTLHLRLNAAPYPTRTTDGTRSVEGRSEDGTEIENHIDLTDIHVVAFDSKGNFIGYVYEATQSVPGATQSISTESGATQSASGATQSVPTESGNNATDITIALDRDKYRRLGDITLVVYANYRGSVDETAFSSNDLDVCREDFEKFIFNLPSDQSEILKIPMKGEITFNLNQGERDFEVSLIREWAKVEVVDAIPDFEIRSVAMKSLLHEVVNFIEVTPGTFHAYLPPVLLDADPKEDKRCITFKAKATGDDSESEYRLYLAEYRNDEPIESDHLAYQSVCPNICYRFTIESIVSNTLKVHDKIVIMWSNYYEHGKFAASYIGVDFNEGKGESIQRYSSYINDFFGFEIDLKVEGVTYDKVCYSLYSQQYGDPVSAKGWLKYDYVKVEDVGTKTYFYLNDMPIGNDAIYHNFFPTDYPYRFYCRSEAYYTLNFSNDYIIEEGTVFVLSTDSRGYKFAQFNLTSGNSFYSRYNDGISFVLRDSGNLPLESDIFNETDIFLQEIDGQKYYVFYYD